MILRFGACEVDLDRVEIRVGGAVVPVQPQVFDVIAYLAEHRDRVVTKEELLDNVWGDRFVSESALTSRIKSARRALDDTGRDQSVIRTVHGRGYRFVADVELMEPSVAAAAPAPSPAPRAAFPPAGEPGERAPAWPFVGRFDEVDTVLAALADPALAGVLLTGPPGAGTSRLVAECLRSASAAGHATVGVAGLAATSSIPLAALSTVLPDDVLDAAGAPDDLARGVVFRRAQVAVEALVPPRGRLVVGVDDADHLDELSEAVLAAQAHAGSVFLVAGTRHSTRRGRVFDELARSQRMPTIEVPPLDDTDVDVILYRVLEGPIDLVSLDRLAKASNRRPGVLSELIESSLRSGALAREDGVWRVVGPLTSPSATAWPLPELSASAVRAAEQLALVSTLHLDDALRVLGSGAVDELDAAMLLSLDRDPDGEIVSLADPVLRDSIVASIGPVRSRGLKHALVDELLAGRRRPDDIATAVAWADELGRAVEPIEALLAARTAMLRGRDDAAETLVQHLERTSDGPNPYAQTIRGELCYRRSQWARSEEWFASVDLTTLDEMTAGFVLRRLSAIDYQMHRRYRESVDWVRDREHTAGDGMRTSLGVHRLTLLTLLGDADTVLEESDGLLPAARGLLAIELRLARARAQLMRGLLGEAAAEVDTAAGMVAQVEVGGPERSVLREALLFLRLSGLVATGDLDRAAVFVREESIAGRRAARSWVPLLAAEIEIESGRMRAAREMVLPALEAARRVGFDNAIGASEGMLAWTLAGLGERDEAERTLRSVLDSLPRQAGANAWHMATSAGRALAALACSGDPDHDRRLAFVPTVVAFADDARARGALLIEANLRLTATLVDPRPHTAAASLGRVTAAAEVIGGRLWPLKLRHVRSIAEGTPAAALADEYRRLGHQHLADLCTVR